MGDNDADDIRRELAEIRKEQKEQRFELKLCVNYMRELALIIGARQRLLAIDRELADQERETDPALPDHNGDTKS